MCEFLVLEVVIFYWIFSVLIGMIIDERMGVIVWELIVWDVGISVDVIVFVIGLKEWLV